MKEYQAWIEELKKSGEESYAKFSQKLIKTKYEILGIRLPKLRKMAKELACEDTSWLLADSSNQYLEEVMIKGFLIATKKEPDFWQAFANFLPLIDNWSLCDSFCNSLKIFSYEKEEKFTKVISLLKAKDPFTIRVGLVIILLYYRERKYLKTIFTAIEKIQVEHYYVDMAIAWLLAENYEVHPREIENFLKKTKLKAWTVNKAIQKINESRRISKEEKEKMKKYKRRKEK